MNLVPGLVVMVYVRVKKCKKCRNALHIVISHEKLRSNAIYAENRNLENCISAIFAKNAINRNFL